MNDLPKLIRDPFRFAKLCWPDILFYGPQVEIIESVRDNVETFVALWFFLTHAETRIITTSVKDDHLRVLWGEIGRFIQTSRVPLDVKKGGPLIINHRDIKKLIVGNDGMKKECKISYLRGMVNERGEGMAGHHASNTLCIIDEASGVDDLVYTQSMTWADRLLAIGNPNPCANFFIKNVEAGDLVSKT